MSASFYRHEVCFLKKTLRNLQSEASTDHLGELLQGITDSLFVPATIPTVGTVQLEKFKVVSDLPETTYDPTSYLKAQQTNLNSLIRLVTDNHIGCDFLLINPGEIRATASTTSLSKYSRENIKKSPDSKRPS